MTISYHMQIDTLLQFRTICRSTHYDHFVTKNSSTNQKRGKQEPMNANDKLVFLCLYIRQSKCISVRVNCALYFVSIKPHLCFRIFPVCDHFYIISQSHRNVKKFNFQSKSHHGDLSQHSCRYNFRLN